MQIILYVCFVYSLNRLLHLFQGTCLVQVVSSALNHLYDFKSLQILNKARLLNGFHHSQGHLIF